MKESLIDGFYSSKDQWGEGKLKRILDDIDKLRMKHPCLRELGRSYMIG